MVRLRARVERAAVLHRQAAAAAKVIASAVESYSPASAPVEQYAEQHELAARLRASAADLIPGWLGASLDAAPAATPLQNTAVPAFVRLGMAHPLDDARFPVVAPLFGVGHLAIDADARDQRVAGLLRSILLRLVAAAAPGTLQIRVIDAACDGDTTAQFDVPDLMPPAATDHAGLHAILAEADHWVRGAALPQHHLLVVVASMPELTDGRDLAHLAHLARTGVEQRLHFIAAGWPPPPVTAETTQGPLPRSTQVSLRNPYAWVGDPPGTTYSGRRVGPARLNSPVYLDAGPPADLIRRVCAELAFAAPSHSSPADLATPWPRWSEYVSAAQRLDTVRRDAAKVVADETAALKRARAELSTVVGQLAGQQRRFVDVLGDGAVPLRPAAPEMASANATLTRIAQRPGPPRAVPPPPVGSTSAFPAPPMRDGVRPHGPVSAPAPVIAPNSPPRPVSGGLAPPTSGGFGPPTSGGFAPPTSGGLAPPTSGGFGPPISGGFAPPASGAPAAAPPATAAFPATGSLTGQLVAITAAHTGRPGRPAAQPYVPEAALAMMRDARAALAAADAELSIVDAQLGRSPRLRNAVIYAAYAVGLTLVQLPMLAVVLTTTELPAALGAPCGLALAPISFGLGWLTISSVYGQPGSHHPPRTPLLGALISLLVALPGFVVLAWTLGTASGS